MHSNEQIRASSEFGGNALLQFSQVGLSCSIVAPVLPDNELPVRREDHQASLLVCRQLNFNRDLPLHEGDSGSS